MIKPLSDRVVIEPIEKTNQLPSGLVIPESAQDKSQEGTVVSLGEGRWSEFHGIFYPSFLKVGDRVIYAKYAGTEVVDGGKKYLLLNEREIFAVISQ